MTTTNKVNSEKRQWRMDLRDALIRILQLSFSNSNRIAIYHTFFLFASHSITHCKEHYSAPPNTLIRDI